jgi:hypothetical protein
MGIKQSITVMECQGANVEIGHGLLLALVGWRAYGMRPRGKQGAILHWKTEKRARRPFACKLRQSCVSRFPLRPLHW